MESRQTNTEPHRRLKVAYGRVSTQQQADEGALRRQEQALLDACGADEVFLDVGSGTNTARPGYQKLLELISQGQVEQLLVADQDRLNRNLQADIELWGLCDSNGTRITNLTGREIEFRSPDGQLLSTIVSALNQHRSRAYGAKTRRGLEQARQQGLPARPRVPFGLRKVRDPKGKLIGIEPDPEASPLARQRIEWFLSGKGLTKTCILIGKNHPKETWMQPVQLKRWLKNPMLTGRLCWHKEGNSGDFKHVENQPSFQGLISDNEAERIHSLIQGLQTARARAGRSTRMLSGLTRCENCKQALSYKLSGRSTWYLRCSNPYCDSKNKCIRVDRVRKILKGSIAHHALSIARHLAEPETIPLEVHELKDEIKQLRKIRGTEELILLKLQQIDQLVSKKNTTKERLLSAALMDLSFWDQPEEQLNARLREILSYIEIKLAKTVKESRVLSIRMQTPTEPFAQVWDGDQDEPLVTTAGEAHWRINPDGSRELIAVYRLSELIRHNELREQTRLQAEALLTRLETGKGNPEDLARIRQLLDQHDQIAPSTSDPSVVIEDRMISFPAEEERTDSQ